MVATILPAMAGKLPERVVLFTIDGLHREAPRRINMPVFNGLTREGTYVPEMVVIIPHHPTIGDYSKTNSCSFPNPVLHQGTLFLKPENKMIQEIFSPGEPTAFVVNAIDYRSVGRGFTTLIQDASISDERVVELAIETMKTQRPVFMRVHLQTPGKMGFEISQHSGGKIYSKNIFGKDSPYVKAIGNADLLLGRFVAFLREAGLWEGTVLIVTSDHGQSSAGWHPLFEEESWMTPLVFSGSGIAVGRQLPYFEITDLAPTIAGLLGKSAPTGGGGAGSFVREILEAQDAKGYDPPKHLLILNRQIREYNLLRARMIVASERDPEFSNIVALLENENFTEPFYHQDRIIDWYKADTIAKMIASNGRILQKLKAALESQP